MRSLLTSILILPALCSCSGMDNVNFVEKDELYGMDSNYAVPEYKYDNYGMYKEIKKVGAIVITGFNENGEESDRDVIVVKRYKSKLLTQSKLYESENKDKTFFDQTFFDFELDKKTKGAHLALSFKW